VGAGAASSLGIGIAWEARFRSLHCDNSPTERLVQSANQRTMSGVCYSTMPAPSASCLVARAAGKPSCWPMGTQRDLGWAQIRLRDWSSYSRAFSRNRYAASSSLSSSATGTAKRDMILQGCMQHRHPRKSHSQRAATQRRLHQSAHHIHPAQRMHKPSASPTDACTYRAPNREHPLDSSKAHLSVCRHCGRPASRHPLCRSRPWYASFS
jgi:hypothetical protein